MSIHRYASEAYGIGEEFVDMLRDRPFAPLLGSIGPDAPTQLLRFVLAERALIERVVAATPKPRQKLLDALPLEKRFWTIAAAAQMAFEAAAILKDADIWCQPGGSYRDKIVAVSDALAAPYMSDRYNWPFPTHPPAEEEEDDEDQ